MKPASFVALSAMLAATVAMSLGLTGCGGSKDEKKAGGDGGSSSATTAPPAAAKTAVKGSAGTTIKGRIVFSGAMPDYAKLDKIKETSDCEKCKLPTDWKSGETLPMMDAAQDWIVDPNTKGVANVLVHLKVPDGSYFDPIDADKKKVKEVVLDQPCCAFVPHVLALYPYYSDGGGKLHATGQTLLVKNSASFPHDTKIDGDPRVNNFPIKVIPPQGKETFTLKPDAQKQQLPINVSCNVHKWMNAKIFVYDHPYAVVTGIDGKFELKNVPAGKNTVLFWHEAKPDFKTEVVEVAEKAAKDLGEVTLTK